MANNKKVTNYGQLVSVYKGKVAEYNEALEELKELNKFTNRLNVTLIGKRRKLKRYVDDLYDELLDMEDYVTDILTFKRETVISFMGHFYSYYFGTQLTAIDIMDNRNSKYAKKATLLVSLNDEKTIRSNFNLDRAVNSDELTSLCKDQHLYFGNNKEYQLYDGVYFNKAFQEFIEIDEVLERAITYKLQDSNLKNIACLERAFKDYMKACELGTVLGEGYEPMDTDTSRRISSEVHRIINEEQQFKQESSRRVLSILDTMNIGDMGDLAPAGKDTYEPVVLTIGEGESLQEERLTPQSIILREQVPKTRIILPEQIPVEQPARVIQVEAAPKEKEHQYQATSTVLLGMLDSLIRADGQDKELKKRK